jgi:hypothetical protein
MWAFAPRRSLRIISQVKQTLVSFSAYSTFFPLLNRNLDCIRSPLGRSQNNVDRSASREAPRGEHPHFIESLKVGLGPGTVPENSAPYWNATVFVICCEKAVEKRSSPEGRVDVPGLPVDNPSPPTGTPLTMALTGRA